MNRFRTYAAGVALVGLLAFSSTPATAQSTGIVKAWGSNFFGQLGTGGSDFANSLPLKVAGLSGVARISGAGSLFDSHTLALKSDGTLWTWGSNKYGELGNGTVDFTTPTSTPIPVAGLSGIIAIGTGVRHSVAVKSNGTVWAWGDNSFGQLGKGSHSTFDQSSVPVQSVGLTGIVSADGGNLHTAALKSDGTVWNWGQNGNGQLGNNTTDLLDAPISVPGLGGVAAIAVGGFHTVALKNDGTVWAWGSGAQGQLGRNSDADSHVPVQASITNVVAITASVATTLALKSDGTLWAFGANQAGELGIGTDDARSLVPVQVPLSGVVAIAAGDSHVMALKSDGTVWVWGNGYHGELGNGTTPDISTSPVKASLTRAIGIAAGFSHSLAIVLPTLSEATADFNAILGAGCIDSSGISGQLATKFAQAQSQIAARNVQEAINTLKALLNQLEAQSGKHISASCPLGSSTIDAGGSLIAQVQGLIAVLQAGGTV